MFGDGTLSVGLAVVAQLLANGPLEESLATFAAHCTIVPT